jgi:hypothetical protein
MANHWPQERGERRANRRSHLPPLSYPAKCRIAFRLAYLRPLRHWLGVFTMASTEVRSSVAVWKAARANVRHSTSPVTDTPLRDTETGASGLLCLGAALWEPTFCTPPSRSEAHMPFRRGRNVELRGLHTERGKPVNMSDLRFCSFLAENREIIIFVRGWPWPKEPIFLLPEHGRNRAFLAPLPPP